MREAELRRVPGGTGTCRLPGMRDHDSGQRTLDAALDGLEQETPDRVSGAIRWLRNPRAKWVRLPIGLLCIAASFFFFLPVIGLEFLPLGLLLVAIDVPFMREPVGRATLWMERKWLRLKARWRRWRCSRERD